MRKQRFQCSQNPAVFICKRKQYLIFLLLHQKDTTQFICFDFCFCRNSKREEADAKIVSSCWIQNTPPILKKPLCFILRCLWPPIARASYPYMSYSHHFNFRIISGVWIRHNELKNVLNSHFLSFFFLRCFMTHFDPRLKIICEIIV